MSTLVCPWHEFYVTGSRKLGQKLVHPLSWTVGSKVETSISDYFGHFSINFLSGGTVFPDSVKHPYQESGVAAIKYCLKYSLLSILLPHIVIYFLQRRERSWLSRAKALRILKIFFFRSVNPRAKILEVFDLFQVAPFLVEWHLLWCWILSQKKKKIYHKDKND